MSTTAVRSPAEFEEQIQRYLYERSEEGRAVRVGEKEVSEQAAIVARYADLFSRDQLRALREEEERAGADQREWLYRLRKTCESGFIAAELAELDAYADRHELGEIYHEASASFNEQRLELLRAYEELEADLSGEPDPIARSEEEKQISMRELAAVLQTANDEIAERFLALRE